MHGPMRDSPRTVQRLQGVARGCSARVDCLGTAGVMILSIPLLLRVLPIVFCASLADLGNARLLVRVFFVILWTFAGFGNACLLVRVFSVILWTCAGSGESFPLWRGLTASSS